jgi:hypothetical protein
MDPLAIDGGLVGVPTGECCQPGFSSCNLLNGRAGGHLGAFLAHAGLPFANN